MNLNRPVIRLKKSPLDNAMDIISWAGIVGLWVYTLAYYNSLPETIPVHYNLKGEIDGYGNRIAVLILPVIATFIIIGLYFLNKHPHIFNYINKITEENAAYNYTIATRVIRTIQLIIVVVFFLINYNIILSATMGESSLNEWLIPAIIVSLLLPPAIAAFLSWKHKRL